MNKYRMLLKILIFILMSMGLCTASDLITEQCIPLDVLECTKTGYNQTRLPNRFKHETISEALVNMNLYYESVIRTGCSKHVQWFVCLLHFPVCVPNWSKSVPPCRSMCERVRNDCYGIIQNIIHTLPDLLDCSNFPENGQCVPINDEEDDDSSRQKNKVNKNDFASSKSSSSVQSNIKNNREKIKCKQCSCRQPFIMDTTNPYNTIVTGSVESCQPACVSPLFPTDPERTFVTLWMGFWSILCALSTLITLLTFLVNRKRFEYPQRPIVFLAACYFMVSLGYIIRVSIGHKAVACDNEERLVVRMAGSTQCSIVFLLTYLFGMAGCAWWVILTFTWFLAAGLKWSCEAIAKYSQTFHFVAWFFPSIQSLLVLTMSGVEGDPIGGLCSTGTVNLEYHKYFIILPLVVYLSLGTVFLIGGFMALVRIRSEIKLNPHAVFFKSERIENLMVKIGIFGLLYTIPSAVIVGCNIYEYAYREAWHTEYNCACDTEDIISDSNNMTAKYSIFMLKYFMSLMIGVTSSFWIWSSKTIRSWRDCICLRSPSSSSKAAGGGPSGGGNNTIMMNYNNTSNNMIMNNNNGIGISHQNSSGLSPNSFISQQHAMIQQQQQTQQPIFSTTPTTTGLNGQGKRDLPEIANQFKNLANV